MTFEQEQRHVYYDTDLKIEAYHLTGIVQPFPNHFHDYYVIGFVEGGRRHLWCRDREYDLSAGYTPRAAGLYKITVDAQGHVSAVTAVTKGDITALGIPAQDTNTTYSVATQSANGLMSAADKKKLDGMVVANFNRVTVGTSAPSNPQKGDIWI